MKLRSLFLFFLIGTLLFVSCASSTDGDESLTDDSSISDAVSESDQVDESFEDDNLSDDESTPLEDSDDEVDESSNPESEDNEISTDVSEGDKDLVVPDFITNFVSFAPIGVGLRATDSTSIRLTGINESAEYGDITLFTKVFGTRTHVKNAEFTDFAMMVCEYNHEIFGYVKANFFDVGEKSDISKTKIPDDGFIILAHSEQSSMIAKMKSLDNTTPMFVHGIQIAEIAYTVKETKTPMAIDGVVGKEWSSFHVDTINEHNKLWHYSEFEKDNYYVTADHYLTYDKDYLYLAVVVNTPYHYCPITPQTANSMWKYECIQVKVSDISPRSEYILEHYDHIIDNTAVTEGRVRSYGFAVNDDGETCFYESGINTVFEGLASVKRDEAAQKTTYEAAIPWSEFGVDIHKLSEIGVTFSINSTHKEDVEKGNWRNLIYRDGGGVIGRNDWAKMPIIKLKHA